MLERTLQFRGINYDLPPDEVPLDQWSSGRNVFFRDRATQRVAGYEEFWPRATDTGQPVFCYPVQRKAAIIWFLIVRDSASQCRIVHWTGSASTTFHTYSGFDALQVSWNFTDLNGTIIVNNGVEVPRYWNEAGAGNTFDELPGWLGPTVYCRTIRAWKYNLFALGLKGDTDSPYEYAWSSSAEPGPGSIPDTWIAAADNDAGNNMLATPQGFIVDAVPVRDSLLILKDFSAHIVNYVGGVFVFGQRGLTISAGMMNPRCATEYNGRVLIMTQDDIILTDGHAIESICTHEIRRTIFNNINPDGLQWVQISKRHLYDEIWCAYPADASRPYCTEAAIYNTRTGNWGFRELPDVSCLGYGLINDPNAKSTWDSRTNGWEVDPYRWDERFFSNTSDEIVMCQPWADPTENDNSPTTDGLVFVNERGYTAAGKEIDAEVSREGVVLTDDPERVVIVTEVWLHAVGRAGDIIYCQVGGSMFEGEPVSWGAKVPFVIGQDKKVDVFSVGRLQSFRFNTNGGFPWRMYNFRVRYKIKGRF